jgi:acetolactate synthase small subunit
MSLKIINITIPEERSLPDIISTFSPEENYIMLKIGSQCLEEGRKTAIGFSQKEIYQKIRDENKEEINKLELDILVEREMATRIGEKISKIYDTQVEQMKKQNEKLEIVIQGLKEQIKSYESENADFVKSEVDKMREKYDTILQEKEKRLIRMTENYEDFLKQNKKSSKYLGDEGEDNFYLLSETFRDFIGYKIEKKSHQGHKGDFHLFFNEFNVLVDLKNYSGTVQKKEVEKIEHDLLINDTMDFAWLISYESNVCEWNRFPITYKWILNDVGVMKCIVIVNNLNANGNPTDILRNLWSITYELHKIINKTKVEDSDIKELKEREYNVLQKIKTAQKRMVEIKRCATTISQTTKDIENDILDAISLLSNEIVKTTFDKNSKIQTWWNEKLEFTETDDDKLTSSEIWLRFKKDNKEYVDENKMSIEDLKNYIKNYIDFDNYIEKSKKGSIELVGFVFKKEELPHVNIELELSISDVSQSKKVSKKKITQVINEEIDSKILHIYNTTDYDVIKISKDNEIMVWQVVSILVKNKVIAKRSDARGYEIYKETDEYKSKIVKTSDTIL